jgi:hypothetical protein
LLSDRGGRKRIAAATMPAFGKKEQITVCQKMGNWFDERVIGDLNGDLQRRYANEREFPAAAYRDLKILAAAINRYFKEEVGGVVTSSARCCPRHLSRASAT